MKRVVRGGIGCLGLLILVVVYTSLYWTVLGHGVLTSILLWTMLAIFLVAGAAWIRLVRGGFGKHG